MAGRQRITRWVEAEARSLTDISRFVQEWLARQDAYRENPKERYLVELAVMEACTNIIRYAYPASQPGRLGISLAPEEEAIEILLMDEGPPFDPTRVPPPDLSRPREGGYGIFLMRAIMSSITCNRRGSRWNCLRLVRELPRSVGHANGGEGLADLRMRIVAGKEKVR